MEDENCRGNSKPGQGLRRTVVAVVLLTVAVAVVTCQVSSLLYEKRSCFSLCMFRLHRTLYAIFQSMLMSHILYLFSFINMKNAD